jgi:hypothetical protein
MAKTTIAALVAVLAVVTFSLDTSAQAKPDFSGTWVMDAAKSDPPQQMGGGGGGGMGGGRGGMGGGRGGMGGGVAGPVVISQSEAELKIQRGDQTFVYKLDGSESTNPGMGGAQTSSRTRWDGVRLVTDSKQSMSGPMGEMTIESHEVRSLSPDGKEMTVETTTKTPRGEATRKLVFSRSTS